MADAVVGNPAYSVDRADGPGFFLVPFAEDTSAGLKWTLAERDILPSLKNRTGYTWTPARPLLSYDDDGNLKDDGRWVYTWDAENR